jgi:hypothetical protein
VNHSIRRAAVVFVLTVLLSAGPSVAHAEPEGSEVGIGVLSAVTSLVYAPIKVAYAITGSIIGGVAWLLSAGDAEALNAVVVPAVRGDYVVMPSHLRGERDLEFIGREPGY